MQKLVIGMQNNRVLEHGFTLIEILVVVLIIGITMGFALLAFGDFGSKRRIVMAAEQFVNYVKFVEQQAILQTNTLGIRFNDNQYQVVRFKLPDSWQVIANHQVLQQQNFPQGAVIHIDSSVKQKNAPQIIIHASGNMSPFKLSLGSKQDPDMAHVIGDYNGDVHIQGTPPP